DVTCIGRNAERLVNCRVDIFQPDWIFNWHHWMPVGGFAVHETLLKASPKEHERVAAAEMAVEAVHFFAFDDQFLASVTFGETIGLLTGSGFRSDRSSELG